MLGDLKAWSFENDPRVVIIEGAETEGATTRLSTIPQGFTCVHSSFEAVTSES